MFSNLQKTILLACGVILVAGLGLLAIDRWIVRAGAPDEASQREAVLRELALEPVRDQATLARMPAQLEAFVPLLGQVTRIDDVLRQQQAEATLYLVAFRSRQRDAGLDRALSRTGVDAPRLLLLIELREPPGWNAFLQTEAATAPAELPDAWHERLARLEDYRMGISGNFVVFVSRLSGSALMATIEANTSPEFHPGLLNSALRVDVQQALDIVGAMPGAPVLERFYRIPGVEVNLPAVNREPLERQREAQRARQRELEAERAAMRARMQEQQSAFRQRNEENLTRFRERTRQATGAEGEAGREASGSAATSELPAPAE
ncbi:MAG: hypothetical protein H6993_16370 [Pseudomonadales bacterium]|nr:hypothetical protein [Pseudomonadales bacterium]MCP5185541.1 hypothetical protein [Pseudomonadales bacterium]